MYFPHHSCRENNIPRRLMYFLQTCYSTRFMRIFALCRFPKGKFLKVTVQQYNYLTFFHSSQMQPIPLNSHTKPHKYLQKVSSFHKPKKVHSTTDVRRSKTGQKVISLNLRNHCAISLELAWLFLSPGRSVAWRLAKFKTKKRVFF